MINVRPGPNGNVFWVDEQLMGADGRANPQFIAPPTTPGEQGQYVYLYGPGFWTADLGLAKNFRIGGDSPDQLRGAVHQRVQPSQHARRQYRRRDVQHRLDDVRTVDDACRRAPGSVPGGLLLLTALGSRIQVPGFRLRSSSDGVESLPRAKSPEP